MLTGNSTLLAPTLQQLTVDGIEFQNYCHTRETFSFARCKKELGYDQAVAFEIDYQGAHQLELQSREALTQVNAVLTARGLPVLLRWPAERRYSCDGCDNRVPRSHVKDIEHYGLEGTMCRECRGADEEASDWTPVDEALGLPLFSQGDFYYFLLLRSSDAVQLASDYPCCDVVDLETDRTISTQNAQIRLEDPRFGEHEKFGVALPEVLNLFVADFCAGLYPALESK